MLHREVQEVKTDKRVNRLIQHLQVSTQSVLINRRK